LEIPARTGRCTQTALRAPLEKSKRGTFKLKIRKGRFLPASLASKHGAGKKKGPGS